MREIIQSNHVQKPPYQRGDREKMIEVLEELLWQDLDAMYQLDNYCLNRHRVPDERVRNLLIGKQILAKDATLPRITNDAMYQMRTGCVPFWVGNKY